MMSGEEAAEAEIQEAAGILVSMRKNEITPQQMQMIQMPDETAQQIQREEDEIALRQPVDEISLQITGGRILSTEEMHSLKQLRHSLPGLDFAHKLYELLCFPDLLKDRIRWSPEGDAIQIVSRDGFEKYGLKLLCKGKFASLERKLQAHGFRNTRNQLYREYNHKDGYFLRAQKQKLKKISCGKPSKARALALARGAETLAEGVEDRWFSVEGWQPLLVQTQAENAALRAKNDALRAENEALRNQCVLA